MKLLLPTQATEGVDTPIRNEALYYPDDIAFRATGRDCSMSRAYREISSPAGGRLKDTLFASPPPSIHLSDVYFPGKRRTFRSRRRVFTSAGWIQPTPPGGLRIDVENKRRGESSLSRQPRNPSCIRRLDNAPLAYHYVSPVSSFTVLVDFHYALPVRHSTRSRRRFRSSLN